MERWTESFRVRAYETNERGLVRVETICDYLQEAANNHAASLGLSMSGLLDQGLAWVLSRLRVEFPRMESAGGSAAAWPGWKSELTVATWPSGLGRLVCLRDYQVADRAGRVLARARSWWLVMDMASRKVVRVPDAIVAAIPASPPAPREQSPLAGLPPLHGDTDATARIAFPVRRSDLDVNRHVNNTRYIAWAVEAVPEPVRLACRPSCLDISFKAETGYGDTVLSRCDPLGPDHPGVFRHSLTLAPYSPGHPGGREAAQALTTWAALEEEPAS